MKRREEIEKLIGGYAAGTLTPTEREELFAAAMDDQELFDILAEEQALKEILDDPEDRKFLRESLGEAGKSPHSEEKKAWWRLSFWPMAAGLATVAAGLAIVTVVGIQQTTRESPEIAATKPAANTPASEPPKEIADARITTAAPPERARKKALAAEEPAPTKAKAVKDTAVAAPEQPKREADQKPAEAAVADKQAAVPAAPPPPPPASQPVQVAAVERKEAPPAPASAAGPSASQLYQTQFRQTQMEQQTQLMRQQQQLSRFAAGELRGGGASRDQDTRAKRAAAPPSGSASGRAAAAPGATAPTDASKAEENESAVQQQQQSGPIRNAGIRYQILRRNSQGQFVETRLDTRFEADDEIVWRVEKNSGGIVTVLVQTPGSASPVGVGMTTQTLFEARSAPFKLPQGTVEFVLMLTPSGVPQTTRADQGLVTESSGNSVYVVAPGVARSPVTARVRIAVN